MQANKLLLEAIALRKCVTATYNRTVVKLAPHILYTRHDAVFIDAVTLERDGQPPREVKLGCFKIDGLNDLALTEQQFSPHALFDRSAEKYVETTLFIVEA